jgi:hypothetical protein
MSINRNGDGSDADNDVFESLQFVYIKKRRKKKEMIVSIYITFALRQTMNFRFNRNNKYSILFNKKEKKKKKKNIN